MEKSDFLLRKLPSIILVRMHPNVRRDLALLRQLDHVHGWRISAFLARPAFQCRFQFPDWGITRSADGIERDAGAGLTTIALDLKPAESAVEALRDGRGGLCGSAIAYNPVS
jgi:hypothetical protein